MVSPKKGVCCCCAARKVPVLRIAPYEQTEAQAVQGSRSIDKPWILGSVTTAVGEVPRVSTALRWSDRVGTWKARWGIGRMRYRVEPGLYAVGSPTPDAPVLVSANYKISFDQLRSRLAGLDAWILVLDTDGVNVWCSAGKGTFGTDEIVRRVEMTSLCEVVSHRTLVVPQLGAPGVAAHEVQKRSGFRVVYGPVRAEDLLAFLAANMNATPDMRVVHFRFGDRVVLIPVELVGSLKYALLVALCFLILGGFGLHGYSWTRVAGTGLWSAGLFLALWAASVVFTAAILPFLPGRALALKGAWLGLALLPGILGCRRFLPGVFANWSSSAAWCLIVPTIASFMAMNFTGSTTYTSLSGVRREMRVALPIQAVSAVVGAVLWLVGRFL